MANVFMQEHAFQNYKDCFALPILAQAMLKIAIVLAACFALPCKNYTNVAVVHIL